MSSSPRRAAPRIVPLGATHRASTVAVLAAAFQSDPALRWIIADDAARARKLPGLFHWLVDDHTRKGLVLGSEGGEVATLWWGPGQIHTGATPTPREAWLALRVFGTAGLRAATVSSQIYAHLPDGEAWLYLRYVGVLPSLQGRGLGGASIRAGIDEANRRGVATCLETCKPQNVPIYQALGYSVVSEWDVPRGGPHFWTMTRPRG